MNHGPPSPSREPDFEAIEAAVMETARGRWFLAEYRARNRSADTRAVLDAVENLKALLVPADDPVRRLERLEAGLREIEGILSSAKRLRARASEADGHDGIEAIAALALIEAQVKRLLATEDASAEDREPASAAISEPAAEAASTEDDEEADDDLFVEEPVVATLPPVVRARSFGANALALEPEAATALAPEPARINFAELSFAEKAALFS